MTLRGRLPVILSELIAKGVTINFGYHIKSPVLDWNYKDKGGHFHLDEFEPGVHDGNMIYIQKYLIEILAEVELMDNKENL